MSGVGDSAPGSTPQAPTLTCSPTSYVTLIPLARPPLCLICRRARYRVWGTMHQGLEASYSPQVGATLEFELHV